MPLYMDIHTIDGVTPEALAKAHAADVEAQARHGVNYLKYWINEHSCKAFCLVDAPTAEAAMAVHREAHGFVAEKIIEVDPDMIDGFMGAAATDPAGEVRAPPGSATLHDNAIRSVVFTDIVGSTEATQRLGDEAAMQMLRLHDGVVREALAEFGGREVKHTGDGIMACFNSSVAAIRFATRVHQSLALRSADPAASAHPVQVRIGIAAGEPVEQGNDLFGSTVQLAARICASAEPGQARVSNGVAELCAGKPVKLQDLGRMEFKGFDQPQRVHAVVCQ
jgi:class 3 adenylate cyclase